MPWEIENPEVLRRAYEKTGNPLYVWQAIAFDIGSAGELPLWVRDYLVRSGTDLLQVAFDVAVKEAEIKNPASEVAKGQLRIVSWLSAVARRQSYLRSGTSKGAMSISILNHDLLFSNWCGSRSRSRGCS